LPAVFYLTAIQPVSDWRYILYVALAKLLNCFINDPTTTLVTISIIATALTVPTLYFLSFKMFGRSNAIISSALLASSPLFWYNGEIALPYALEGFVATSFAYVCYMTLSGHKNASLLSSILLALATGIRQNAVLLLFPLWLFSFRKLPLRRIIACLLLCAFFCLLWFIPLVILTKGFTNYMQVLAAQYMAAVAEPVPVVTAVIIRTKIFLRFLLWSLTIGIPAIFFLYPQLLHKQFLKDVRITILLLWIAPATAFFITVNIWNPGHIQLILPPLFILLGQSLPIFSRSLMTLTSRLFPLPPLISHRSIITLTTSIIVAFNIVFFLFANAPICNNTIKDAESKLRDLVHLTKSNTLPNKSIILACWINTQAAYYMPEYRVYCPFPLIFDPTKLPVHRQNLYVSRNHQIEPPSYWMDTGFQITPINIPEAVDTLVVLEEEIADYYNNTNRPLQAITSKETGARIFLIKISFHNSVIYNYHSWTLK
jgi:hypothetical protein